MGERLMALTCMLLNELLSIDLRLPFRFL
jgi:hypothetical protein